MKENSEKQRKCVIKKWKKKEAMRGERKYGVIKKIMKKWREDDERNNEKK